MKKYLRASPILLAVLVHGLNCDVDNNIGGGFDTPPPGICILTDDMRSHVTPPSPVNTCDFTTSDGVCECEAYNAALPNANILNQDVTSTLHSVFDTNGCNKDTAWMWAQCAHVAEASGKVSKS